MTKKQFRPVILGFCGLCFLLFAGCGVTVQDKDKVADKVPEQVPETQAPATPVPPPEASQPTQDGDLIPLAGPDFQILEGANPKEYQVELQLPPETLFVVRIRLKDDSRERIRVNASKLIDDAVISGESYRYEFMRNQEQLIASLAVNVPLDILVNQAVSADDLNLGPPVRRFFMTAEAQILTGTKNVTIQAESLILDPGAKVLTFPLGFQGSDPSQKAPSGGLIRILALRAVGALKIEMRGAHGAPGVAGAIYEPQRAADGMNREMTGSDRDCSGMQAGGDGAAGAKGHAGGNGGEGGNSGRLDIGIQDVSQFKLETTFEAGAGGPKGLGGAGQEGGNGGVGEQRMVTKEMPAGRNGNMDIIRVKNIRCDAAPNGQKGAPGPAGDDGGDGKPGITESQCDVLTHECVQK